LNPGKGIIIIKPEKDWIQLESPITAEFSTYKLPVDKEALGVSSVLCQDLELSYKRARNSKEYENMRKLQGKILYNI
jgi:hypothetical protein